MSNQSQAGVLSRPLRRLYYLVLFSLVFSGFGQIPFFKRYYVADLPGMAWTADFYVTLIIHYLAASMFLGLVAYYLVYHAIRKDLWPPKNGAAWLRGFLFLIMILTGGILAARNISWITLPPWLIVFATFTHISAMAVFLIAAATWFRFRGNRTR